MNVWSVEEFEIVTNQYLVELEIGTGPETRSYDVIYSPEMAHVTNVEMVEAAKTLMLELADLGVEGGKASIAIVMPLEMLSNIDTNGNDFDLKVLVDDEPPGPETTITQNFTDTDVVISITFPATVKLIMVQGNQVGLTRIYPEITSRSIS